ncbi:hypothetical protein B0H11DRAFT_1863110 [Mycena galericulata]|nr:hypothetical protein B0H11DRAFT_1863110 [Mycena galericulata]
MPPNTDPAELASSVVNMPLPGEPTAPRFRGRSSALRAFLFHYERLLTKNNIVDPDAQCEEILQYCSPRVAAFIRGCASYHAHNWPELRAELVQWYGPEPPMPLHVVRKHADQARLTPLETLPQWKRYYRSYCAVAGELHNTGQLDTSSYLRYFFRGIHPELQKDLTRCLWRVRPEHDAAQPWPMEDVCLAARQWLTSNRWTLETDLDLPETPPYTGTETDSEDGSDSEDGLDSEDE